MSHKRKMSSEPDIRREEIYENVTNAEQGDAEAQNILGARLVTGWYVEKDVEGGFYWYCQAIRKGHVTAKWNAGTMIINGDDHIQSNEVLGMRLIEEAADGGESSACLFISSCYTSGKYGKEVNKELADYWQRKAWGSENVVPFNKPIDLSVEYGLNPKKPEIKVK